MNKWRNQRRRRKKIVIIMSSLHSLSENLSCVYVCDKMKLASFDGTTARLFFQLFSSISTHSFLHLNLVRALNCDFELMEQINIMKKINHHIHIIVSVGFLSLRLCLLTQSICEAIFSHSFKRRWTEDTRKSLSLKNNIGWTQRVRKRSYRKWSEYSDDTDFTEIVKFSS